MAIVFSIAATPFVLLALGVAARIIVARRLDRQTDMTSGEE